MRYRFCSIAILAAVLSLPTAQAAIVTYTFTGVMDDDIVNPSNANVVYAAGTTFSGTVGYDTDLVATGDSGEDFTEYTGTSASGATTLQFSIGSDGPISTQSPSVIVYDNAEGGGDSLIWSESDPFNLNLNGVPLRMFSMSTGFIDYSGTIFDSTALPTTAFPASAWDGGVLNLMITNQAGNLGPIVSRGHLLTINGVVVPEPSTSASLTGCLALMLVCLRRRRA